MLEVAVGRSKVIDISGIDRSGRAVSRGGGQHGGARQAIAIKTRMELATATDPFGPKRNLVLAPIHRVAPGGQRRFTMITHMLCAAGRDEAQYFVARHIGIVDDFAVAVIADQAPMIQARAKGP